MEIRQFGGFKFVCILFKVILRGGTRFVGIVGIVSSRKVQMKFQNVTDLIVEFIVSLDVRDLSTLTRDGIAYRFGINKSYLSEKFKEDTRRTVWEFINFEKMKRAEQLLRTRPDLSVKDISRIVGIVKAEQFRARFCKIYGLKPGKYRRTCHVFN